MSVWDEIKDFYRKGTTHLGFVWLKYDREGKPESLYTKFNQETNKYVLTSGPDFKEDITEEESMVFAELLIENNKKIK
jgi:hypothetical protein